MVISELVKKQKCFFETGKTKDIDFRIESLNKLYKAINKYEGKIEEALKKDLNKSKFESYMTEIGKMCIRDSLKYIVTKVETEIIQN